MLLQRKVLLGKKLQNLKSEFLPMFVGIFLLKVNNRNTRILTRLLTLNLFHTYSSVSIVNFKHANAD